MIRRALALVFTLATTIPVACRGGTTPPTPIPTIANALTPAPTTRPTLTPVATHPPAPSPTSRPAATPTPSALRPVIPIEEILPGTVEALHSSPDGALWLVTGRSVAQRTDNTWSIYLADFVGDVVGIDAAGRVWVLGEDRSAIAAWDGSGWTGYGAEEGWAPIPLEGDRFASMGWGKSGGSGDFWLATPQDVRVFDGEGWTVFSPQEMGMGEIGPEELWAEFTVEVAESTGTVWVGECDWGAIGPFGGQGVRRFDGQTWHGTGSPVSSGCATAIEEDGAGRVWMGIDDRLWRYDPASGQWTELAPPESPVDALRFGFVHGIGLDRSDEPWPAMVLCGASCYGKIVPYHVHDGDWVQIGEALEYYGLPYRLVTGPAGQTWLLCEGNVFRIVEDVPEPVTGTYVQHVTVDVNGQAWFVASHEGQDTLWTIEE